MALTLYDYGKPVSKDSTSTVKRDFDLAVRELPRSVKAYIDTVEIPVHIEMQTGTHGNFKRSHLGRGLQGRIGLNAEKVIEVNTLIHELTHSGSQFKGDGAAKAILEQVKEDGDKIFELLSDARAGKYGEPSFQRMATNIFDCIEDYDGDLGKKPTDKTSIYAKEPISMKRIAQHAERAGFFQNVEKRYIATAMHFSWLCKEPDFEISEDFTTEDKYFRFCDEAVAEFSEQFFDSYDRSRSGLVDDLFLEYKNYADKFNLVSQMDYGFVYASFMNSKEIDEYAHSEIYMKKIHFSGQKPFDDVISFVWSELRTANQNEFTEQSEFYVNNAINNMITNLEITGRSADEVGDILHHFHAEASRRIFANEDQMIPVKEGQARAIFDDFEANPGVFACMSNVAGHDLPMLYTMMETQGVKQGFYEPRHDFLNGKKIGKYGEAFKLAEELAIHHSLDFEDYPEQASFLFAEILAHSENVELAEVGKAIATERACHLVLSGKATEGFTEEIRNRLRETKKDMPLREDRIKYQNLLDRIYQEEQKMDNEIAL